MIIQNKYLRCEIEENGGQIHSLKRLDGNIEYMWQGDPQFWKYKNPTLFPIVGSTFDRHIRVLGQVLPMEQHGFARLNNFKCVDQQSDRVTMRLCDNDQTRAIYPFAFNLDITYRLWDEELYIDYRVENKSEEIMPFQFGLHPAFSLDYQPNSSTTDFKVIFHPASDLTFNREERILSLVEEWDLSEEMFKERGTWMFKDVNAPFVSLTDGKNGVTVGISGYKWLCFWKKPNAPFLCIEPWHGHGDYEPVEVDLSQRDGTLVLHPHQHWITSYSIKPF